MTGGRVTIVMGCYNGARYLREQLQSFTAQTYPNWRLVVSDDGSSDMSREIVTDFARERRGRNEVVLQNGPGRGFATNFLTTLADQTGSGDYFALSDQDDIWYPDKLERAVNALRTRKGPALYGACTDHINSTGQIIGESRPATQAPSFRNALLQNAVSGHTAVLNAPARELVHRVKHFDRLAFHDWFLYQLVSGAGGEILLDPTPVMAYRQHGLNAMGSYNDRWRARAKRSGLMVNGQFGQWMRGHLEVLSEASNVLTPEHAKLVKDLQRALNQNGFRQVQVILKNNLSRSTALETWAVIMAASLGRL